MTIFQFISWPLIIIFVMLLLLLDVRILFSLLSPHFFIILSRRRAISFLFHIEFILMMVWLNQILFSLIGRAAMSIFPAISTFFLILLECRSAPRAAIISSTPAPPSIASFILT